MNSHLEASEHEALLNIVACGKAYSADTNTVSFALSRKACALVERFLGIFRPKDTTLSSKPDTKTRYLLYRERKEVSNIPIAFSINYPHMFLYVLPM